MIDENLSTMPRIERMKSRLDNLFLKDRGNLDEQTADLVRSDIRAVLERYFTVNECAVRFALGEDGGVRIVAEASVRRSTRR